MSGVDFLDAHVSVYRIVVRGKKWYLPHYINTLDILKSAAFQVFCLTNADYKMDYFLAFTRRIVTHYLKAAKIQMQLPPNVIFPRKRSLKGNAAVAVNERKEGQHFIEKSSQKRPRKWCPICKVGLCMEPCFNLIHTGSRLKGATQI